MTFTRDEGLNQRMRERRVMCSVILLRSLMPSAGHEKSIGEYRGVKLKIGPLVHRSDDRRSMASVQRWYFSPRISRWLETPSSSSTTCSSSVRIHIYVHNREVHENFANDNSISTNCRKGQFPLSDSDEIIRRQLLEGEWPRP